MASGYSAIGTGQIKGMRLWTFYVEQFFDDLNNAPSEARVMTLGRDVSISYATRAAEGLARFLPLTLDVEVLDGDLYWYDLLEAARLEDAGERAFRLRLESDDGAFAVRTFLSLDNVSRKYAYWIRRTVTRLSGVGGLGKLDDLVRDIGLLGMTSVHSTFRNFLQSGLHDIPLRVASIWYPDGHDLSRPHVDDTKLDIGYALDGAPLVGISNAGEIAEWIAGRFNWSVFQALDGAWNVEQWFAIGEPFQSTDGFYCESVDYGTNPALAGRPEKKLRLRERDGRIERGVDVETVSRFAEIDVDVEVQVNDTERYSLVLNSAWTYWRNGDPAGWVTTGTVTKDTRPLGGGGLLSLSNAARISPGGEIYQDTVFLKAGAKVGFSTWFALEDGGATEAEFQVVAFPFDGSAAYYLQNDGTWSTSAGVIQSPTETPDASGADPLTYYDFDFASEDPLPTDALIRFACLDAANGTSEVIIGRFEGYPASGPGERETNFGQRFLQYDAGGDVLSGRREEVSTSAPSAEVGADNSFIAPSDRTTVILPSEAIIVPARTWVYDDGVRTSTDLSELVAADLFDFNGSGQRMLVGQVDAIVGPATALVAKLPDGSGGLEDVEFVLSGAAIDVVREITDGVWMEKNRKYEGTPPA